MKKIFNLLLVFVCCLSFIPFVNAEEAWSSLTEDASFINELLTGKSLTDNSAATSFFEKYDVYYTYQKIDDTLYGNYVSDISEGTSTGAIDSVNELVPSVSTTDDLGSWIKATEPALVFNDLEYEEGQKVGYIIAIAAVDKTDNTKIYVNRSVYEVTGSSSLESSFEINCNEEETTTETPATTETTTEENPNTGISDFAIYLVPIALIGGAALMMRKNYA